MRISNRFNRYLHGVILKEVAQMRYLRINERVFIRPFYLRADTLKMLLKYADFNYPRQADGAPISYTKASNTDLLSHIAFIDTLLFESGYTPRYIKGL